MGRYLSLVCIIKNEQYLEEFILYHYLLGVEHFYIYDNESDIPIKKRLNHYLYQKICTINYFPGKVKQIEAYNHCIFHYGKDTEWLAIIDGDEYILPKKHDNLVSFLKDYENYSAIAINWINFGSNYYQFKQQGYLIENYTYCEIKPDGHIKTICRPKDVKRIINPHFVLLKNKNEGYIDCNKKKVILDDKNEFFNYTQTTDIIQINHYWGKSYQEMEEKIDRGRATMNSKRSMPPNYHILYNEKQDNLIITKYLNQLKNLFEALNTQPEMYKILNNDLEKLYDEDMNKYIIHLIDHGIRETRPFKIEHIVPTFNLEYYRKNYTDLHNLTCMQLVEHYVRYGKEEGRICDNLVELVEFI